MKDPYIEKFRSLNTFAASYMRDVTYTMRPDIQALTAGAKVIGRAFTVKGPDIYLNALESIPPGSIYVHGQASDDCAVWGGLYAERYGKSRGLVAAVIDGGVHGRTETVECEMPTFARFVSPLAATNRETGHIQEPVKCGGVTVHPDDILIGDENGVVVIPRRHEQEIYDKMDAFLAGLDLFGKIAKQPGVVVSQHEALGEMMRVKYAHPPDYWRYYEPWATKWRKKYGNMKG
jgi:4-hydroxy-4-methyl-2-oxoglutarate aldolase